MKIALYNVTTTTQFGGVESFVWEVARVLAGQQVETTIVSGRGSVRKNTPGVKLVEFPFTSRHTLRRVPGFSKAFTLTKLIERLTFGFSSFAFMRQAHFDAVHIQKPYDLPAVTLLKAFGAGKIVFGCHGTDFFTADRFFSKRADASVSCSAFNAAQINARYGLTPNVIYNGFDPEVFHPEAADRDLRRVMGGAGAVVLYVGRLVEWKGVQHLIAAIGRLAKERDVRLTIAGEGDYRARLQQLVNQTAVANRVNFLGFIPPEKLRHYYAASDIVALPSYANETFGISILEAMACERATVGSRFGGIPEVIADGETGLLASPEDADDLAAKLACLLDDNHRREEMAIAGRKRAVELFTWNRVIDRLMPVYSSLV